MCDFRFHIPPGSEGVEGWRDWLLGAMVDLRESFREVWSQALVGLNAAEVEVERALMQAAEMAGLPAEEMKRHVHEFGERLTSQRKEIERAIDEAVQRAVSHIKLPTAGEVEALRQRLEQISGRIEAVAKKREDAS